MSGLLALSPGTMSMPSSPTFNAASRVARLNRPLGRSVPWQRRQDVSKIGLMSAVKLIGRVTGAGSLETSTPAAATNVALSRVQSPKPKVQSRERGFLTLDLGLW